MKNNLSKNINLMKAAVLNKFGEANQLMTCYIPIPDIAENDVLIKIEYAGVGQWDIFEREGGYAEMLGMEIDFPYVIGSEGSGTIVSKGENVKCFNIGDKVIATGFLNPKGGFYAEYVAIDYKYLSLIPECINIKDAGVISGVGTTALRGLEDTLSLKNGESIIIFGASGGIGHLAVQLAKCKGARVFAIASGEDGVQMVRTLGIDNVINGYKDDILSTALSYAPKGFDAALLTAGGDKANLVTQCVKNGGRIAYPNGIYPVPTVSNELNMIGYNGEPDADIINRFNNYIKTGNIKAYIDKTFLLDEASIAHIALEKHYLGKLCLKIS